MFAATVKLLMLIVVQDVVRLLGVLPPPEEFLVLKSGHVRHAAIFEIAVYVNS